MGKEEFLTSRMSALSKVIKKAKPGVVARNTVQSSPAPNNIQGIALWDEGLGREGNQKETSRPSSPSRSWTPRPRSSGRAPRGDAGLGQQPERQSPTRLKGAPNGSLATITHNEEVMKADLVKNWRNIFGKDIAGHSRDGQGLYNTSRSATWADGRAVSFGIRPGGVWP